MITLIHGIQISICSTRRIHKINGVQSRLISYICTMRKLLAGIFLIITSISFAQTTKVSGKCVDKRGTPIDNVTVYSESAKKQKVYTDEQGEYTLLFEDIDSALVIYRTDKYEESQVIYPSGKRVRVKTVKFPFQQEAMVTVQGTQTDPFDPPELAPVELRTVPGGGGVEKYLVYTTAAVSNNELTTNYNVRGGSYDENLVYVNGFQVYRTFLTRAGQQEGMSFIHTALVNSINFSAGGFDSQYGDKMSSVLDITYRRPKKFGGSLTASLLGVEAHVEQAVGPRFDYIVGARYNSNGYLLNALPTKGAYNPVFWDAQILTNLALTENLTWSVLGHFSSKNYRFQPESSETDFGTANEAYSFRIYFEGGEQTRFQTMYGGTSLKWKATEKTNLDFYATVFNTVEREYFDILGEYFINELETDPSKEEFGDSIDVLGVGAFLEHARNKLDATIINIYHNGDQILKRGFKDNDRLKFRSHALLWGVNFQADRFDDRLSEWTYIDSAGYSVSSGPADQVTLFETIKGDLDLQANRYTGFLQLNSIWSKNQKNKIVTVTKKYKERNKVGKNRRVKYSYTDTIRESASKWSMSLGARGGFTTSNNEFWATPRAVIKYYPRVYMIRDHKVVRRNVNFHFATGMYYQPPFYREFRTFDGNLNLDVLAQKSIHAVLGTDVYFDMWDREVPFKFTAEAYYKYMWDLNTYEIENVRLRYYANNESRGYAYGLDMNVHGQFVEGIESFFKVGFLRTEEDIIGDSYTEYYNAAGEKIIFGYSDDQVVVDSAVIEPGFVPRPTDQLLTFGALIQDRMPKFESFSVQMGMQFGSRLPYGPPDFQRYKDTLRMKSYFRVDIGMSYDFLYKYKKRTQDNMKRKKEEQLPVKENFFTRNFRDAMLSFEVFNLLGVNNVLSKQWVQDVSGKYYSIPNYLTQRRFNLKLILVLD